jgi:peptide/nickel transport system ATP-binding protein
MTKIDPAMALKVSGLSVEFVEPGTRWRALDDVRLEIRRGEILGLVGESGAGKSLTGAAIIRLLPPKAEIVAGRIEVDGTDILSLSSSQIIRFRGKRVGSVFQDPLTSLDPLFTIGDQLVETIRLHMPADRHVAKERAIKLLDEVGIPAASRRFAQYPHEFSGGMRQRVVIALALCADPALLIADEPTTALDVSIQAQVLALLRRLCEQRAMGMLLITHDLGVVAETAHRVAVLYAGRIVEQGPVSDVIGRPMHPYAERLMNSIPQIGRDLDRLPQIAGMMPRRSPDDRGCSFGPRCNVRKAGCSDVQPQLMLAETRQVACFNPRLAEA